MDENKKVVCTISEDELKKWHDLENKEIAANAMMNELHQKMTKVVAMRQELWSEVYVGYGIDKTKMYELNMVTGEIYAR